MRTPKGRWAHGLGRREADGSDAGLTRSRARGPVQGTDRGWGQRGPNHTHSHPNMAVTYPNDVRQDKGGRRGQVGAEQAGALARATPRGPRRRAPSPGLARGPAAAPPASEAPGSPLRGEASAPPPGSPANSPRFFSLLSYSSTGGLARERPAGSGPEAVLSEHAVGTGQPRRRQALPTPALSLGDRAAADARLVRPDRQANFPVAEGAPAAESSPVTVTVTAPRCRQRSLPARTPRTGTSPRVSAPRGQARGQESHAAPDAAASGPCRRRGPRLSRLPR